jgi:predicted hydrocarbon binding protein
MGGDRMIEKRKTDNHVMRVWLETIKSIMGVKGLESILNYAHMEKYIDSFPPDNDKLEVPLEDLQNLYRSLLELFGRKGIRGLQLRVGRESARLSISRRPDVTTPVKRAAHLLSEPRKMRLALEKFIEQIEQRFGYPSDESPIELQEGEDSFLVSDRAWFESEGVTSTQPACGFLVGMLQYIMEWITGNEHHVEEIECRSTGCPADVFKILKAKKEE